MNAMVTKTPIDDGSLAQSIRQHLLCRIVELGSDLPLPADITLTWPAYALPSDMRLFIAQWIDRSGQKGLGGLWTPTRIETRPAHAIELLFNQWQSATELPPDAMTAALICCHLLDPEQRRQLITADTSSHNNELLDRSYTPAFLTENGHPPLRFYWVGDDMRITRITIDTSEGTGHIHIDSQTLENTPVQSNTEGS
jgi:hypothetical protein